jgi:hypothetical protein
MILPIFAINAYLSYIVALFSMSMTGISIFAATNVICLALLLYSAFMKRAWTALLFVFIPIPAGFLIMYIMVYFREFTKNVI